MSEHRPICQHCGVDEDECWCDGVRWEREKRRVKELLRLRAENERLKAGKQQLVEALEAVVQDIKVFDTAMHMPHPLAGETSQKVEAALAAARAL